MRVIGPFVNRDKKAILTNMGVKRKTWESKGIILLVKENMLYTVTV